MSKYVVDITIEVEAENANHAWEKANYLVSDYSRVVEVSEPVEIEEVA